MSVNLEAIRAKLAKTKASLKRAGSTIKPKQGKSRYVILPPYKDDGSWHHNYGQHFIKDAADQLQAIYICSDRTNSEPCPICDTMAEAQRTVGVSDPAVAELIKKQYARQEFLIGVLALDTDTPDDPQVLQVGKTVFDQLVTLVESWAEQVFDPTNPQIIVIERTGTGIQDTKYTAQPAPNRHTYKKAVKSIDLDEFVKQESEQAEKKALLSLRAVAGLSGAPRLGNSKPADKPTVEDEFQDVPDSVTMRSAPAPAPAAAPAQQSKPALDESLDSLLEGIDV